MKVSMKVLASVLLLSTFSAFAQSIYQPEITRCDRHSLSFYKKPNNRTAVTIPTNIKVEPLEAIGGDPAMWSLLHMIKVEFPVNGGKNACFLIKNAYIESEQSIRSIGYDAFKGRLIQIESLVGTMDDDGMIGETKLDLKIRVNQARGTLRFE
jgi:hypothetical protein